MKKRSLPQWICLLSGLGSAVFFVLHDLLGIKDYPGYEWVRQAVSNMTAKLAPSVAISTRFGSIFIMLACVCASMVFVQTRGRGNKRLQLGIALFCLTISLMGSGYALFPLDHPGYGGQPGGTPNDFVHFFVVTGLVVIAGILALFCIALSGRRENGVKWLARAALGVMVGLLGAVFGLVMWGVDVGLFGLFERIGIYGAVAFQTVLGVYVFVGNQPAAQEEALPAAPLQQEVTV